MLVPPRSARLSLHCRSHARPSWSCTGRYHAMVSMTSNAGICPKLAGTTKSNCSSQESQKGKQMRGIGPDEFVGIGNSCSGNYFSLSCNYFSLSCSLFSICNIVADSSSKESQFLTHQCYMWPRGPEFTPLDINAINFNWHLWWVIKHLNQSFDSWFSWTTLAQ